MDDQSNIVIADFGLSVHDAFSGTSRGLLYETNVSAPEWCTEDYLDSAIDAFAVGCCLFKLFAGAIYVLLDHLS